MADDKNGLFSSLEIDAIGEIMNISLGSSATAVSTLLDRRVNITTPRVSIKKADEFEFKNLQPALAVEITYVEGLDGRNLMLLRRGDVRKILEIMMMTEIPEEDFELDELSMSAVCELMNQMMGSAATALSELMEETVNISTPVAFEVTDAVGFKEKYFDNDNPMVIVSFNLDIEDCLNSEFMTMISVGLVKKMVSVFGITEDLMGSSDPAPAAPAMDPYAAAPAMDPYAAAPAQQPGMAPPQGQPAPQAQMPPAGMAPPPQDYAQQPYGMPPQQPYGMPPQQPYPAYDPNMYYAPPQQRMVNVQNMSSQFSNLTKLTKSEEGNLDLIMSVPLQVSVEIGRTRKQVKEILALSSGSLVVLDKLAGEQVDIFVNGQHIAKGDVVVVEDNFGVRITEIIKNPDLLIKNE